MYKLGIDLGGTNIVAGVVDENFKIIATAKRKTALPRSAEEIADDMAAASLEAIKNAGLTLDDIDSCGIGAPGSVDTKTGNISYSNNLGFYKVPLTELLKQRTGKDFYIENDANAAAYGEYIAGVGKGSENFVAMTLGTGVGAGIIIDGKIYSGSNGAGGEIGHIVVEMNGERCTCGRNGCLEMYASATGLINQTRQAMERYPDSIMWKLSDGKKENANGLTAFDAMRKGDIAGKMVVDKFIEYLSVGVANVINIFQPDVLCIGGGVSHEGDALIIPLKQLVNGEDYARNMSKRTIIKTATLGNDAGIIGAAYLCNLSE